MRVERRGKGWVIVGEDGSAVEFFETNAEAWRWIDRNTNLGGEEGDHAGRQDWSIKRQMLSEILIR